MAQLSNRKVAVIATHGFEDSELTSPVDAVKEAGATVTIISTEDQPITGKNGTEVQVDLTSKQAKAEDFDALLLPGGTGNMNWKRIFEACEKIGVKYAFIEQDNAVETDSLACMTQAIKSMSALGGRF